MTSKCLSCGDTWEDSLQIIYRTAKPECYIFQGDKDDPKNGMKFHVASSIKLQPNTLVIHGNAETKEINSIFTTPASDN